MTSSSDPPPVQDQNDDLFSFPCQFPIKVMGKADQNLEPLVMKIIRHHCQDVDEKAVVTTRTSSGGKYIAMTVTIMVHSRAQLDNLYQELSRHEQIMIVL